MPRNRKNRAQLTEEAQSLGIDSSAFETNAEFEKAIEDSKSAKELSENPEPSDKAVDTDTDLKNPQDDQEDVEAPIDPEDAPKGKKAKKSKEVVVETTRPVQFNINGEAQEGTVFSFAPEVAESRKAMLVERYGQGVIKE